MLVSNTLAIHCMENVSYLLVSAVAHGVLMVHFLGLEQASWLRYLQDEAKNSTVQTVIFFHSPPEPVQGFIKSWLVLLYVS